MKIQIFVRGEKIKEMIILRNATQGQIADEIGIHPTIWSAIITGRRTVGPKLRKRLVDYFRRRRFTWDDLFTIKR